MGTSRSACTEAESGAAGTTGQRGQSARADRTIEVTYSLDRVVVALCSLKIPYDPAVRLRFPRSEDTGLKGDEDARVKQPKDDLVDTQEEALQN